MRTKKAANLAGSKLNCYQQGSPPRGYCLQKMPLLSTPSAESSNLAVY
jgi:hypothetical protein